MAASFINRRSKSFKALFEKLPADAQRQARDAYALFKQDPAYPGLDFHPIGPAAPDVWRVNIGAHYRALAHRKGQRLLWYWIGTHEAYNRLWP